MLRQKGGDVKTAQESLRHLSSRTSIDLYQQSVSEEKRSAHEPTFVGCLSGLIFSTLGGCLKEDVNAINHWFTFG
jgi:hypothetical protein